MVLMNIGGEGCGEEEEEQGGGEGEGQGRKRDGSRGNMLLCYALMGTVRAAEKKVRREGRQRGTHIST